MGNKKDHPLYQTWKSMKQRCSNPNSPDYPNYGGRGIEVCDEWKNDFEMFVYHLGPKPSPEHTLDRVDNDWHYCPENCRWATKAEQQRNSRRSLNAKGYKKTPSGNYQAQFQIAGVSLSLGRFPCPLLAHLKHKEVKDAFYPHYKN